jgi:hypothetical protein
MNSDATINKPSLELDVIVGSFLIAPISRTEDEEDFGASF